MAEQPDHPVSGSYWVKLGRLLAGPYPGAWVEEITRDRLKRLLDARVALFVDLTQPGELPPYALYLPPQVQYRRLSIPDMEVPDDERMVDILDTIDAALADNQPVYVHCWGGIGRTGTVVGCWLVRHGMAGAAALDEIIRLRGGLLDSPQTDEQARMVRRWREGL